MHLIVFHYANITGAMGIPGVIQKLVADLRALGRDGVTILGSDLTRHYAFDWSEDGQRVDFHEVATPAGWSKRTDVMLPWGALGKVLKTAVRLKMAGSCLIVWPWGLFAWQQGIRNWNGGRTRLLHKRAAIHTLRLIYRLLADYCFVFSRAEAEDSGLDPRRCTLITMGKPTSAIFRAIDAEPPATPAFASDCFSFIGRGMWVEKGLSDLAGAARREVPLPWPVHCFLSGTDPALEEQRATPGDDGRLHWHSDVFGADLVPWLRRSAAAVTVNRNPAPLRSIYEALYAGTPVIVAREQYMDGFQGALTAAGMPEAVREVDAESLAGTLADFQPLDADRRQQLAERVQAMLCATTFAQWLLGWLGDPSPAASYFDHFATGTATHGARD